MLCPHCGDLVSESERFCAACGADAGYPNVRMAQRAEEVHQLNARLAQARASAKALGYESELDQLGTSVASSEAVIARPLRRIIDLIEDAHRPYSTYHQEVSAGIRAPEDNKFDRTRTQFENAVFPNYFQQIRFGALTINQTWPSWFGDHAFILKEMMIAHRATVFEENPATLAPRLRLSLTDVFPPGYRATWDRRGDLAMAKLYPKLDSSTRVANHASLIMSSAAGGAGDYIEVHVFGPFNRSAIAKILGPRPRSREDRVIWAAFKRSATKVGIAVEETP